MSAVKVIEPGRCDGPLKVLLSERTGVSFETLADRPIVCTPIMNEYAIPAYWVLTIKGTPPKGTIIYDTQEFDLAVVYVLWADKSRKLNEREVEIVEQFINDVVLWAPFQPHAVEPDILLPEVGRYGRHPKSP